jgi:hypothetical protein
LLEEANQITKNRNPKADGHWRISAVLGRAGFGGLGIDEWGVTKKVFLFGRWGFWWADPVFSSRLYLMF